MRSLLKKLKVLKSLKAKNKIGVKKYEKKFEK